MKAFILTDGGVTIGFGHVTRCISLFQALQEQAIDVEILIHGDESVSALLDNIEYRIFDWINGYQQLKVVIDSIDLLIIDSMIGPTNLLLDLAGHTKRIAYIDDSRRIECDAANAVIIDWTPFVEKAYKNSKVPNCTYLLGCDYISLRKPFWDMPDKIIKDNISEVLITMGGGDLRGISPKILQILINELRPQIKKTVIIGRGFTSSIISLLEKFTGNDINLVYYPGAGEMASLFANADMVISAGGQTLYELARTGTPTIAIEIVDNQKFDIEAWQSAQFIYYAGKWDNIQTYENIRRTLKEMIADPEIRRQKKYIGSALVDGQGARRIVDFLINDR